MAAAQQSVLSVRDAKKRYGRVDALQGIDVQVRAGEALGLLGPNGAGKSTLVKAVCGLVRLDAGSIEIGGDPAGSRAARRRIGYLAELFRFPPWLTVDEVLQLQQRLSRSIGGATERTQLLDRVDLTRAADRQVAGLSKGMQQRLGIAQAIVGSPQLVVFDEPTSALDPEGRAMVRDLVRELADDGRAVLISSHLLGEIEQCCDRIVILAGGIVRLDQNIDEIVVSGGVEVETADGTVVHPNVTRDDVPDLVRQLVAAGQDVFAINNTANTLEDSYLRIVAAAEAKQ